MGKNPAFQFYPGDWRRDTQVQMAAMETRGVWIEMLCCMWDAPDRGKLSGDIQSLSRLLGCETNVLTRSLVEIERYKIGDVTQCNNSVTVINRRMFKEEKERKNTRLRVQKYRKTQGTTETSNASVTPPSSSSPSSSLKDEGVSNDTPLSSASPKDKSVNQCPHDKIIRLYHQALPELPEVKIWNNGQRKILRSRWKEAAERQSLTWWEGYFSYIRESAFLMGGKTEFCADLEWIVRPSNMAKIINGRYHRDRALKHSGIAEWLRIREEKRKNDERG